MLYLWIPDTEDEVKQSVLFVGVVVMALALALVVRAISARDVPRRAARRSAVAVTKAGSFRVPLNGAGVRKGASVSTSTRSKATDRTSMAEKAARPSPPRSPPDSGRTS